jgi:hypothetical protein
MSSCTHGNSGPPAAEVCPDCRRPVDDKRRCWHCNRRACSRCGRNTSSAFIELCILCDFADKTDEPPWGEP